MKTVFVVGGGFPGLVSALAIASMGIKVRLFDVKESLLDSQVHVHKPIVINASSWRLLSTLNITSQLIEKAFPLEKMHVIRQDWAKFSFNADGDRFPYLGYVVLGVDLQNVLGQAVMNHPNIECHLGTKISTLSLKPRPKVSVGKKSYVGDLIIATDGFNSWCRKNQKMEYEQKQWNKKALILPTVLNHPLSDAYLRFVDFGTVACIPSANGYHQIIMTADDTHPIFEYELAHLESVVKELLKDIVIINHCEAPKVFELGQGVAPKVAIPGMVLIGDAGFAIPPVGAQGLNLAFYDIGVLADTIAESLSTQQQMYSPKLAERFNSIVMPHHHTLLKRVSQLVNLFNLQNPILKLGHGVGLWLMEKVSPFKHHIAEFGMGIRYPVPALLRGRNPDIHLRVATDE